MNTMKISSGHRALTGAIATVAAMAVLSIPVAVTAETVTLKGKGTYFVNRDLMPLGNGGAVLHTTNTTVVSVEPSESGVMFGECAGLAYIAPDSSLRSRLYCNFSENGTDTFVVQADLGPKGNGIEVLGGSGRWKDATGTGKVTPVREADQQGFYTYEFHISTP